MLIKPTIRLRHVNVNDVTFPLSLLWLQKMVCQLSLIDVQCKQKTVTVCQKVWLTFPSLCPLLLYVHSDLVEIDLKAYTLNKDCSWVIQFDSLSAKLDFVRKVLTYVFFRSSQAVHSVPFKFYLQQVMTRLPYVPHDAHIY